ncbi:hypothetical protein B0J15DRAFT_38828 [Fusarium solani]|uniref:Glucose-methanol-choline oxidoreductase N-terminal domain-containing protein n=1 Tax=Fusarium solani TaxID=169388 RepID=A0A9P9K8G3_FUSSL|nr:uncharacterized protein B0J15DRAFT_38828 [Fusarium solani]KAH7253272.1 hypothetical protein B0J15DRAFT_38828 [Fusarium solani]
MLWDYIVVGAGLCGSVLVHELLEKDPDLKILVVEAGINANDRQDIVWPNSTNGQGGDFDWSYASVPQTHLDGRSIPSNAGKGLGGGTLINGAAWVRGHSVDYNLWAKAVGDERWSYEGLLPYMKQTESFFTQDTDKSQHGFEGNMKVQSISSLNRTFPMRKPLIESWEELGISPAPDFDHNRGNPMGIGEMQENRNHGRRQQSSLVFPIDKATVLTETLVQKVITQKSHKGQVVAQGVQLANGTQIRGKEVILSAGAYRTPQILMLSGLGPKEQLQKHGIKVQLDLPKVGQNLHDHAVFVTAWGLKDPSKGWAVESGNPLFKQPQYGLGLYLDFVTTVDVPKDGLAKAIEKDTGKKPNPKTHPLLNQERAMATHTIQYAGASQDGSAVISMTVLVIDQSRGQISLSSSKIKDAPLINANFMGAEVDRYAMREAVKHDIELLTSNKTIVGREIISGELGDKPLTTASTDEEIDARIRAGLTGIFHPMGTAAMGRVVDKDLKVLGVQNLRVVDASVIPQSISGNIQVVLYATALQAAGIIGKK